MAKEPRNLVEIMNEVKKEHPEWLPGIAMIGSKSVLEMIRKMNEENQEKLAKEALRRHNIEVDSYLKDIRQKEWNNNNYLSRFFNNIKGIFGYGSKE